MLRWRKSNSWRRWVLDGIPDNGCCVEVGVWKGDFSATILSVARPRELNLVDPWKFEPRYPARWYGGAGARSQSEMDDIHAGVVRRFRKAPQVVIHKRTSVDAAAQFADQSLDWVYIDGDHSYGMVKADLLTWIRKIKHGRALYGDDYDWLDESGAPAVRRAVEDVTQQLGLCPAEVRDGQFRIAVPD